MLIFETAYSKLELFLGMLIFENFRVMLIFEKVLIIERVRYMVYC